MLKSITPVKVFGNCTKIVEEHAGNIDVVSVPGQGSTFTLRLPIVRELN